MELWCNIYIDIHNSGNLATPSMITQSMSPLVSEQSTGPHTANHRPPQLSTVNWPVASVQPFSSCWTSLSWNLDCGFRLRAGHLLGLLPGKGRYRGWLFPILSFPDLSSWLWIYPVYTEDDNWSSIILFCKGLPLPVLLCWRSGE